ncbi:hypothetical protein [Longimicrobium sp.]|uniref:hypothetical protein n=1 Tax=Longimicrobium sp. TaxID=2029185 RepID=UPI003B3B2ABB
MPQPKLNGARLWRRQVQKTSAILVRALELLEPRDANEQEDDLNRKLYFCLLQANREATHWPLGAFDCAPVYEGRNLPSANDFVRTAREGKRPDFQWTFIDHQSPDPKRSVRTIVIECKRLGAPTRHGWPLNENYVRNGIMRFVREEHGYACDDVEAVMVGYIQSMDFPQIAAEVNATTVQEAIPSVPPPVQGWNLRGVSHLAHTMERTFGVTPFGLLHFWVDLRN